MKMMLLFISVLLCTIGLLPVNAEFNCPVSSDVSNYPTNPVWTASIDGLGVSNELLDANNEIYVTNTTYPTVLITVTSDAANGDLWVSSVSVKVKSATKVRWDNDAETDQETTKAPQTKTHTFDPMKQLDDVIIEVFADSEVEIEKIEIVGCLDLGTCEWEQCDCDGTQTKDQNCDCPHTAFPSGFQAPTCGNTYATRSCNSYTKDTLDYADAGTAIDAYIERNNTDTLNNDLLFNSEITTQLNSNSDGTDKVWLDLMGQRDVFNVEIWTRYAESVTITYHLPQAQTQTETKAYNGSRKMQAFIFSQSSGDKLDDVSKITFDFGYPSGLEIKVKRIWVEVCKPNAP